MQGIWDVALCAAYQTVNSVVRAVHTAGNQCLGIGTEWCRVHTDLSLVRSYSILPCQTPF